MQLPTLIAAVPAEVGIMPKIIFWILLILWALGSFAWTDNPNVVRGTRFVQVILFAILGYYLMGF